jgi:hypothetical protein
LRVVAWPGVYEINQDPSNPGFNIGPDGRSGPAEVTAEAWRFPGGAEK